MTNNRYIIASLMLSTSLFASQYTVQNGDSLYSIAKKHNTTVEKIKVSNSITDASSIKSGLIINIADKDSSIATLFSNIESTNKSEYEIKNGDSLYSISKANNIKLSALLETNEIDKDAKLKIGDKIFIPTEKLASNKTDKKKSKIENKAVEKAICVTKVEEKKYTVDESKFSSLPDTAQQKIGKKYVWGAVGPHTFDCSGLSTYVYKQKGITLPRTANAQSRTGQSIERESLLPGDLVFFDTSRNKTKGVNHVGIYIGNNRFIHASSAKHQVIETSLDSAFYKTSYRGAKRVKS